MNIYNIKNKNEYNLLIRNDELKYSKQSLNFKNYHFYYKDPVLPGSNTPVSFSNDRIINSSYILTSDNDKNNQINDLVTKDKLSSLLPVADNIWRATWRRIKN
jgi:hypothetical protein